MPAGNTSLYSLLRLKKAIATGHTGTTLYFFWATSAKTPLKNSSIRTSSVASGYKVLVKNIVRSCIA